jgi:uncharacterized protein
MKMERSGMYYSSKKRASTRCPNCSVKNLLTTVKDCVKIELKEMIHMERKFLFEALVGSHNYNLNTNELIYGGRQDPIKFPASDKDFKVFVFPTFEDLYKGKSYSHQVIGEKEDLDIHDVRKLSDLFFKSNINFIEVLYSTEMSYQEDLTQRQKELLSKLFHMRDDIVRMNLPHLFNACGGMHLNKMKLLRKGTEGTQHLVEAFGYDTKQALHAYRVLNFIDRFAQTEFKDFVWAMKYYGQEREFMLEIKHGFFEVEHYENFVSFYHDSKFKTLKEKYHSVKPNLELKEEVENIIMELIRIEISS